MTAKLIPFPPSRIVRRPPVPAPDFAILPELLDIAFKATPPKPKRKPKKPR